MKARSVLLPLALAGCSQLPRYERPAAPVAPTFPFAGGGGRSIAPDIGFRDFFADPRLRALIDQALLTNRDLAEAALRIDEARAQFRITRVDRLPSVDLRANARFGGGASSGGTGGTGGATDPTNPADPGDGTGGTGSGGTGGASGGGRYRIEAAVTGFELDFWGRVRSLTLADRSRFLASIEAQRAFRISLISDVAEAYLLDREFAERVAVADAAIAARRTSLRLTRRLFDAGVGSLVEVNQELALLTQAEADAASLRRQQAQNGNLLQLLVGRPLDAALPAPRPLAAQDLVRELPVGLPSDLLTNRPDILAAEQRLVAANADVGAARAAFFPRIALTGAAGLASQSLIGLFSGGAATWSFVPQLVQPLFNRGRNGAALDLAGARRELAVVDYERTIQTAFREVADALAGRRFLAEERAARERERAAQAERARLAELRFRAGEASTIESLDARRDLFAAEQAVIAARRAELAALVSLYASLGGGVR